MEKFIVSARKYRPQTFSAVVGQSHITTTLKNAINQNQLAHAFLFCGPRGVGKTTCARILGKTINCENRTPEGEACNTCNSCVSFNNGTSLNIHELDAASNNSVDDIRTLVDQVRFSPQAGKYKVYIVDEVHMLSPSAFNAFLKTLEEPPPFAIFILATTEKHKILPTILSRCQIFDFKRITIQDTISHLQEICNKENIKAEKSALHVIAEKSEGCLRDSLSLLDKIVSFTNGDLSYANTLEHLNILDEGYYFQLLDAMQDQKLSEALLLYDEINRKGFEGDLVLNGYAEFLRNILVSKDPKVVSLLEVSEDFKPKYLEAAAKVPPAWLISALNILSDAEINYRQAKNKKLHVELTLIKLSYLNQALELTNGGTKKKIVEASKSISFKSLAPDTALSPSEPELKPYAKSRDIPKHIPINQRAALFIEADKSNPKPPPEVAPVRAENDKPKTIPQAVPHTSPQTAPQTPPVTEERKPMYIPRLGSLQEIREKVAREQSNQQSLDLTEEELFIAWNKYIEKLEADNSFTVANCFKNAKISIRDSNCIDILVQSTFLQKIADNERAGLINFLQAHFNNRMLTYQVSIDENYKPDDEARSVFLSAREQYAKMIEDYPLVKQLKDKLKLRLDF